MFRYWHIETNLHITGPFSPPPLLESQVAGLAPDCEARAEIRPSGFIASGGSGLAASRRRKAGKDGSAAASRPRWINPAASVMIRGIIHVGQVVVYMDGTVCNPLMRRTRGIPQRSGGAHDPE